MKHSILLALIFISCSENKNAKHDRNAHPTQKKIILQDSSEPIQKPDLSIKGLELKPYSELKNRSEIIENVKRIGYGWEDKERPVNMQQMKYFCGEPDAISENGDDAIMLYFYEREDIQKTWVLYIIFKDNLLHGFALNDATVNDHSKFTILDATHMPK